MKSEIGIIIVTYGINHNTAGLEKILRVSSTYKKSHILIVNNGPENKFLRNLVSKNESFKIINLNKNLGIAGAQNTGIRYLFNSCDAFIFFDQDSTPCDNFVEKLLEDVDLNGLSIFGPIHQDDQSKDFLPLVNIRKIGFKKSTIAKFSNNLEIHKSDIIISSGMMVTKSVFQKIGMMKDSFFIDGVDTEFCLRARSNNIPVRVKSNVIMKHRIGKRSTKFLCFNIYHHSKERVFYQLRNTILYLKFSYIPKTFAFSEIAKVISNRFIFLIKIRFKFSYLQSFVCGITKGIIGLFQRKYYDT